MLAPLHPREAVVALPPLCAGDLPTFIDRMAAHEVRLVAGVNGARLRELLRIRPPALRPVVFLDLAGPSIDGLREAALKQLAQAVEHLWPFAWDGEDFAGAHDDPLTLAHLPIRLAALAERVPGLSPIWARRATLSLIRGRGARVPAAAEVAWEQLALMLAPGGLIVAVALDPDQASEPFARVVEWLAARADVAVVVLTEASRLVLPSWGRLLYGARMVLPESPPEAASGAMVEPLPRGTLVLLAAPAAEGRPHPLSAAELRLFTHIQDDVELRPLFGFNILVDDVALLQPRVDLLWRAGRVVVEIDGAEHRAAARYRADRDRDHRLMCAGYRVLRLTNEDVVEDGARAVEKIRDVVRLVAGRTG